MPKMWEVTPEVWNDGRGRYFVARGDGRVVVGEHSSPTFEGQYLEFTYEQWRAIVHATHPMWNVTPANSGQRVNIELQIEE